jgi:hypothetical protein
MYVGAAVGVWLWMAWANGRGHRWALVVFAMFFGVNVVSLFSGLTQGSATYARADLIAGSVLCLVALAAVVLISTEGPALTACTRPPTNSWRTQRRPERHGGGEGSLGIDART